MNSSRRRRVGFTLLELLLVIGILVALAGVGVVAYTGIKASSDKKLAKTIVANTAEAVDTYYMTMDVYPEDEEGLNALINKPEDEALAKKWPGSSFLKHGKVPVDPWGNELKYKKRETDEGDAGPKFIVYSFGPDKEEDTEDDIKSYEEDTD